MKTAYGKLIVLIVALVAGTLLLAPMRFGGEDYLYPHPRSVRMNPGDSYALSYRLDADEDQPINYTSTDERVATVDEGGRVVAVAKGTTKVLAKVGDLTAECWVRCNFQEDATSGG